MWRGNGSQGSDHSFYSHCVQREGRWLQHFSFSWQQVFIIVLGVHCDIYGGSYNIVFVWHKVERVKKKKTSAREGRLSLGCFSVVVLDFLFLI
jgi:uncharacterized membrane protein